MMHWIRKVTAGLAVAVATGVTAWTSARSAIPQPPVPATTDIAIYVFSGRDPLALATALLSAVSAGWSFWQMFQAPAATTESLKPSFDAIGADVRDTHGAVAVASASVSQQITEMAAAHSRDLGALHDRIEGLKQLLTAAGADGAQAQAAGQAVEDLLVSDDPVDREIGELAASNATTQAAERLLERAATEKTKQNERLRQAARLLSPLQPSRAIGAYREALDSNPADALSWTEMGRLQKNAGFLKAAAASLAHASDHEQDQREQSVIDSELIDLLMTQHDLDGARQCLERAMLVNDRLIAECGETYLLLHDRSVFQIKAGDVARDAGDLDSATRQYEDAVRIRERLLAAHPDDAEDIHELATAKAKLGRVEVARGALDSAADIYQEAEAAFRGLLVRSPRPDTRRNLAITLRSLSRVRFAQGRKTEALLRAGDAAAEFGRLAEVDRVAWGVVFAESVVLLARMVMTEGDLASAARQLQNAVAALEPIAEAAQDEPAIQLDLAEALGTLGTAQLALDDTSGGEKHVLRAYAIRAALYEADKSSLEATAGLAKGRADLAILMLLQDDPARAHRQTSEAISIWEELADVAPDRPDLILGLDNAIKLRRRIETEWPEIA